MEKNIKIKPDPNENEEVTLGFGRVQKEPRDDGPSGADNPSPNSSDGICQSQGESSTVHNSIDNSLQNTKNKTCKNTNTSELSGGIKTSNRLVLNINRLTPTTSATEIIQVTRKHNETLRYQA